MAHARTHLPLRVDHEGPALAPRHENAVVYGHIVGGQAHDVPLPHLRMRVRGRRVPQARIGAGARAARATARIGAHGTREGLRQAGHPRARMRWIAGRGRAGRRRARTSEGLASAPHSVQFRDTGALRHAGLQLPQGQGQG